jgi:hypothetical protein
MATNSKRDFWWWLEAVANLLQVGGAISVGFLGLCGLVYALAVSPGGIPILLTTIVVGGLLVVCASVAVGFFAALLLRRE